MNERCLRIGTVSSIDYDNAMISVTYPQYDGATTAKMPAYSFTDEYKMPIIGSDVLVMHDEAGQAAGFILGRRWNKKNTCDHTGKGVFRKELAPSDKYSKCYDDYDDESCTKKVFVPHKLEIVVGPCPEHPDESGEIVIRALGKTPKIRIIAEGDETGTVELEAQGPDSERISASAKTIELTDETTTNSGEYQGEKDVIAESRVSLAHHTHPGTDEPS